MLEFLFVAFILYLLPQRSFRPTKNPEKLSREVRGVAFCACGCGVTCRRDQPPSHTCFSFRSFRQEQNELIDLWEPKPLLPHDDRVQKFTMRVVEG